MAKHSPELIRPHPQSIALTKKIKDYLSTNPNPGIKIPTMKERPGKGCPVSSVLLPSKPGLVGAVFDRAFKIAYADDRSKALDRYRRLASFAAHQKNASYQKYRDLVVELIWDARAWPEEKSLDAITHLCQLEIEKVRNQKKPPLAPLDKRIVRRLVDNALLFFQTQEKGDTDKYITVKHKNSNAVIRGVPDWMSDEAIWEIKSYDREPRLNEYLQILGYATLYAYRRSFDPNSHKTMKRIGIYSAKADMAWWLPFEKIPKAHLTTMAKDILEID